MKPKSAFTLIELLVVIAIIALLVSMLMPVIASMVERGRLITCGQRKRELHTALMLYANDHQGDMPSPTGDGGKNRFTDLLSPYMEGEENYNGYGIPPRYRCPNHIYYNINVHTTGMNYYYGGSVVRNGRVGQTLMLADVRSSFYMFSNRWNSYFHFRHYDPTRQGEGKLSAIYGDGHWETFTKEKWAKVYSKPHEQCKILNPRL